MKLALDLAVALPGLLASSPLIAALAVCVKLDSPGPAFFRQVRMGRGRQPFHILKLRTMTVGADQRGPQVTASADARITRVGRLLRRTKLDELPQLWNVVRGEMSLVGPRPEVERYVSDEFAEWKEIFSARPGITDSASLAFRDEEELLALAVDRERAYREVVLPAKLRVAAEGVRRSSVLYDARVLLDTAKAVLRLGPQTPHPAFLEARRGIEELNARIARERTPQSQKP